MEKIRKTVGGSWRRSARTPKKVNILRTCKISPNQYVFSFGYSHNIDRQLQKQLHQGFKTGRKKYLYFDSSWLNGCVVQEQNLSCIGINPHSSEASSG